MAVNGGMDTTHFVSAAARAALAAACVVLPATSPAPVSTAAPYLPQSEAAEAQIFHVLQRQPGGFFGKPDRLALGEPLDPRRYDLARQHMKRMPAIAAAPAATPKLATGKAAPFGSWAPLGPDNIGGRTRALVINPLDGNVMYAGGVAGGVWKTTDRGAHWAQTDGMPSNLAVTTLALDPSDPQVIYAGTGEAFYAKDGVRGDGIFRSGDGGATWTRLPGTDNIQFLHVYKVLVSPHSTAVIYAATDWGVFRSTDGGASFAPTLQNGPANGYTGCQDLALRTDLATDVLLAACGFGPGGIWRNPDAGGAGVWTSVYSESGLSRTALAIAPSDQDVMYALASDTSQAMLAVLKSTDGGVTWDATVRSTSPHHLSTLLLSNLVRDCNDQDVHQGWYDIVIAVDPTNSERVWAGGVELFRSDDGAQTFNLASRSVHIDGGNINSVSHADRHAIVFDAAYNGGTNQVVYVADDGGIQKTSNALAATTSDQCNGTSSINWTTLNNGYQTAQFYYGAVYPGGERYLGGMQDNGTARNAPGSPSWDALYGGDGGAVAVDPTNTNVLLVEATRLSLAKSSDGGLTFSPATTGISGPAAPNHFIVPFVMDPTEPQVLWMAGIGLWRTDNQADSWVQASALLAPEQGGVSAIAVAPSDGNIVLAGTNTGYILRNSSARSATALTPWPAAQLADVGYVSALAIDPANPLRAYATVSSFGARHVWSSEDGGATWSAIDGTGAASIPDVPVNSVLLDPENDQVIFLGSDLGCFVSLDRGTTWNTLNAGMGNAPVRHLVYESQSRNVFAFTHGLGAFVSSAQVLEPPPAPADLDAVAGSGQVTLTWSASLNASSYNVYRATAPGSESPTLALGGLTTTSAIVSGLTNGTTYYFVVRAVNDAGASSPSIEVSATPQAPPSPSRGGGASGWALLGVLAASAALRRLRGR